MSDLLERINDRVKFGYPSFFPSDVSLLSEAAKRLEDLENECDDARCAARWLFANLDHAGEVDVEGEAERTWPWLGAMKETAEILADQPFADDLTESIEQLKRGETVDWEEVKKSAETE